MRANCHGCGRPVFPSCPENYPAVSFSFRPIEFSMGFCVLSSVFLGFFLNPVVDVVQATFYYTPSFQSALGLVNTSVFAR
jgi:hypothetical protein